jgi:membrane protein
VSEHIPDNLANVLHYGYYPVLILGLMVGVAVLYRVALPEPLPTHRLIFGAILATAVFVIATLGLRVYLRWITSTGYTYGALSTPIAFLLFAFFGGFAIMLGAELNAAIQEEFPAPRTHAHRLRNWLFLRSPALRRTAEALSNPVTTNPATQQRHTEPAEPPT